MNDTTKKYFAALRESAIGLPLGPFRGDFPGEFRRAASEFSYVLAQLALWALAMVTYPVSIFLVAAAVVNSDEAIRKAYRKADEEWMQGMSRGIDCDE
jgi:hypothetical protein